MTKYFCDRCGREIKDMAYTISISTKALKYDGIYEYISGTTTKAVTISRLEPPIYCEGCTEEFEKFLKGE